MPAGLRSRAAPSVAVPGPTRALVDNVVATVDVKCLAGDEAGCVVRQESGGDADIVDADPAAGRSLGPRFVKQLIELRYSRSRPRCQRPGRNGVHTDALGAQLSRHVTDRALERGFGNAHDVVV